MIRVCARLGIRIVFHEHHLCPDFQFQFLLGRVEVLRESALDFRLEIATFAFQSAQSRFVDFVRLRVMRGQRDIAISRLEIRNITAVQQSYAVSIHLVVAYFVKEGDEVGVMLSVDMFQFHAQVIGTLQYVTAEEIDGFIVRSEHLPFFWFGDGCQLVYVANHQYLHATEGSR